MNERLVLHVGDKNVSSWSMRPWVALRHKGLDFEERTIVLSEDRDRSKRRALSPTGKVPVLQHGDLVIPDSLAILEYVEETFPPPRYPALWPAERAARARARFLAATMHSSFPKLRESMSFNLCFLPTPPPATREAHEEAREMLALWEGALAAKTEPGPFLLGAFSGADAMFAPAAVRLQAFRVATSDFPRSADYMPALLAHAPVAAWLDAARKLAPKADY